MVRSAAELLCLFSYVLPDGAVVKMLGFDELEQSFSEEEARAEARLTLAMREGRRVAAAIDALLRRG